MHSPFCGLYSLTSADNAAARSTYAAYSVYNADARSVAYASYNARDAISRDIEKLRGRKPSLIERALGHSVIAPLKDPADFLAEAAFDGLCRANNIAMEGPGGRDGLLDIFDKLGVVMHFAKLPFLTDYVLNPRWLTYGVYSIMCSEEAKAAKGTRRSDEAERSPLNSDRRAARWQRFGRTATGAASQLQ